MKYTVADGLNGQTKSGPARDLWIEIKKDDWTTPKWLSGPARDLWIEITFGSGLKKAAAVGSRKGPVD